MKTAPLTCCVNEMIEWSGHGLAFMSGRLISLLLTVIVSFRPSCTYPMSCFGLSTRFQLEDRLNEGVLIETLCS